MLLMRGRGTYNRPQKKETEIMKTKIIEQPTIDWNKPNLLQYKHNKDIIVLNIRLEEKEGIFVGITLNAPNKNAIGCYYTGKKEDFELFEGEITLSNG